MALNRKLTPLLAGRKVKDADHPGGTLILSFDDGSHAHIKTGAPFVSPSGLKGREVKSVRQAGDAMSLDFTDGSSAEVKLVGPTSSVMVRDRYDNLEYAD